MTFPESIFNSGSNPIENKANWLGRYLSVEKRFTDKLAKVLSEAALNIDDYFGDLVKENVSTKVARVRIGLAHKEIRRQMRDIFGTTKNLISNHQQDAAVAAVNAKLYDEKGILSWLLPNPVDRLQYADSLRQTAKRNIESTIVRTLFTEKPLSARVYKTEALANGLVSKTINNALARGDSARNLAKDVRALIDPTVPGGVSYAAMRLGRTELNNAFHAQSIFDTQETPWVQSMRWNLSKRHEKDPGDECETYAATGSFSKENVPEKPHPNCRCFVTPELPDYDDFENALIQGHYDSYLDSVMGQGFSQEHQGNAFAAEKPIRVSKTPAVKWNGPKVGKPLVNELKQPKFSGKTIEEKWGSRENLISWDINRAWASTKFDDYKDYFRKGAHDVMRVGFEKFPEAYKDEIVERLADGTIDNLLDSDPGVLRAYGKEIVARAVHSEPTTEVIYRGMMIESSKLEEFMPGNTLSLPLSSFDTDESFAIDFAQGRAWRAKETQQLKDPFPIILQLENGAKVAHMGSSERVAFGQFDIIDVNPPENVTVVRLSQEVITEKPTVIVIRQKSMLETNLSGGRMTVRREGDDDDIIPDYIISEAVESVAPQGKLTRETLARVKKLLPNARIDLPEGINEDVFKEIVDNLEPMVEEFPEVAENMRAFGFKEMASTGHANSVADDYPEAFKAFPGEAGTLHFNATLARKRNGLQQSVIDSTEDFFQYPGVAEDPLKTLVTHEFIHTIHYAMGGQISPAFFNGKWKDGIIKAFEANVTDPSKHNMTELNKWMEEILSEMPKYANVFQDASPSEFMNMDPYEIWTVSGEQAFNRPDTATKADKILWDIFSGIYKEFVQKKPKRKRRKRKVSE